MQRSTCLLAYLQLAAYLLIALIDGSFSSLLVDDDRVPLVFELGLKLFGEEKETLRRC